MTLTVWVVVVDLVIRMDQDGGSWWNGRQPAFQLGVHHQVIVFIDTFKLLCDAETFMTWMKDDLSLTGELATCTIQIFSKELILTNPINRSIFVTVSKNNVQLDLQRERKTSCTTKPPTYTGAIWPQHHVNWVSNADQNI